jgi:hypothetical protein
MSSKQIFRLVVNLSLSLGILLLLAYIVFWLEDTNTIFRSDFVSFYTGGTLVKEGKGNLLYDLSSQFEYQQKIISPYIETEMLLPFRNPSFMALFFLPFSFLTLPQAYKLFFLINVSLFFLLVYLLQKHFPRVKDYFAWPLLMCLFIPNIVAVLRGQYGLVVILIILLIYHFIKKKRDLESGVMSGLLLIKPQYLLLVPFIWLFTKDKRKYLLGLLTTIAVFVSISILVSGLNPTLAYPQFLINTEIPLFGSHPWHMFTLYSFLITRYLFSEIPKHYFIALNLVLYTGSFWFLTKSYKKIGFEKSFLIAILLTVLFSIHALVHGITIILVGIFILLNLAEKTAYPTEKKFLNSIAYLLFILPWIRYTKYVSFGAIIILLVVSVLFFSSRLGTTSIAKS